MDATEADGYVVRYNKTSIDVGSVTKYTVMNLRQESDYIFAIQAHQDLLGPQSDEVTFTTQTSELMYKFCNIIIIIQLYYSCCSATYLDTHHTTHKPGSYLSGRLCHSVCCTRTCAVDTEWCQHNRQLNS